MITVNLPIIKLKDENNTSLLGHLKAFIGFVILKVSYDITTS